MEGIWAVPNAAADDKAGQQPAMLTAKGVFGAVQGHSNRPIAVDPGTGALFVGVGSIGNVDVEPEPKATIQRFDPDGSKQATFASGTRNPTALAFHPRTGELWAGVQERDGLGDDLPSDYLIRVEANGFYGWPYAYLGKNPQPAFAQLARDKVAATIVPDLLLQAHSSLLDLVFYEAEGFPPEYRGHAFAALKGSWNRSRPTGYKLVRVPFRDGRPEGFYENFATGFWASGEQRAEVWGRPAALAVARDGALLVADDTGGTIWRISYTGAR
jgi:glucose/arabinose dehydrogenase